MPKLSIRKTERLKSKKVIEALFAEGKQLKQFPVMLTYIETPLPKPVPFQIGVTVSKRKFAKAVDRNRIKRLMREAIRIKKHEMLSELGMNGKQFALMFLYTGNKMPDYKLMDRKISALITSFKQQF